MFNSYIEPMQQSQQQQPGLLDQFSNAMSDPTMAFAAGLLGSTGASSMPHGIGPGLANGIAMMQQAQQARAQQMQKQQELASQNALRQAQVNALNYEQQQKQALDSGLSSLVANQAQYKYPDLMKNIGLLMIQNGNPQAGVGLLEAASPMGMMKNWTEQQKNAYTLGYKPGTQEFINYVNSYSPEQKAIQEQKNQELQQQNRARSEVDVNRINNSTGLLNAIDPIREKALFLKQLVENIPSSSLGKFATNVSKYTNKDVQTLITTINGMGGDLRQLKSYPGSDFSDADLHSVLSALGDPYTDKQSIQTSLDNFINEIDMRSDKTKQLVSYFDKNQSLKGFDDYYEKNKKTNQTNNQTNNQTKHDQQYSDPEINNAQNNGEPLSLNSSLLGMPQTTTLNNNPTSLLGLPLPTLPNQIQTPPTRIVPPSHSLAGQPITKSRSFSALR